MAHRAGLTLLLAAALALTPHPTRAQSATHLGLSVGFGSLWDGFRFDLAHHDFGYRGYSGVGFSVGTGGVGVWANASRGYGGHGLGTCWDVWHGPAGYGPLPIDFYYSDLYYDCVLLGPRWAYTSWRSYRRARHHPGVYVSVHWRDPYWNPWTPYWAYDPRGAYWNGWYDGYRWGRWDSGYGYGYAYASSPYGWGRYGQARVAYV